MTVINQSNFVVRVSGRQTNSYYIDYAGAYKAADIAKLTGLKTDAVQKVYTSNGAVFDESQEVFYFGSLESAKKAIAEVFGSVKSDKKCKMICLSEAEVEYIRKALINEGSNSIHLKSKIKDEIFKKLNA
jgi:hypothetical protein